MDGVGVYLLLMPRSAGVVALYPWPSLSGICDLPSQGLEQRGLHTALNCCLCLQVSPTFP